MVTNLYQVLQIATAFFFLDEKKTRKLNRLIPNLSWQFFNRPIHLSRHVGSCPDCTRMSPSCFSLVPLLPPLGRGGVHGNRVTCHGQQDDSKSQSQAGCWCCGRISFSFPHGHDAPTGMESGHALGPTSLSAVLCGTPHCACCDRLQRGQDIAALSSLVARAGCGRAGPSVNVTSTFSFLRGTANRRSRPTAAMMRGTLWDTENARDGFSSSVCFSSCR